MAMVSLIFRSGCRVGEVPWIDLDHVVRDADGVITHCIIGGDDGAHTKSGKRRLVPITDETPKLLERYLRHRGQQPGPLFLGREAHTAALDRRLQAHAICDVVQRAAKQLGIAISPHDMRRGWAIQSKRRGVDAASLKRAAGWASDAMMNRYFGPEGDLLAVEAFHTAAATANNQTPTRLRIVS